ncbi:tRNA lysidine(34) synthetase [Nocardia salmonicida]|uniref:hypothetical protein n=1 Tax=Nocardia salmonicida TaxID=53431 RepID=UPI0007A41811|nr:hypothetical protein [Nocardia salmonicida]
MTISDSPTTKFIVEDVLGSRELTLDSLTIGQALAALRLPETMFQPYLFHSDRAVPIPLSTVMSAIPTDAEKVVIRAIRNTLYPTVVPAYGDPGPTRSVVEGVGFRQIRPDSAGLAQEHVTVLGHTQARTLVAEQVTEFTQQYGVGERGCVFGVSGGGDSNALAYGLASAMDPARIDAFTLVFGAVFSEEAAVRADVLCHDLGIPHRILRAGAIADLLGITTSLDALYADFQAAFGNEALHFFGTFLVLRCARKIAAQKGFTDLAFGYNREDLLAEALFMLVNGRRPLQIPVRPIGDHRIVMPVWKAPKLLLDACHPQFSLENYRERDPFTTRQRSLAFFLSHALDAVYPAFGLSLLTGITSAFDGSWGELTHQPELDVFVTEYASAETVTSVLTALQRHFG